jgi:hypothetical protein
MRNSAQARQADRRQWGKSAAPVETATAPRSRAAVEVRHQKAPRRLAHNRAAVRGTVHFRWIHSRAPVVRPLHRARSRVARRETVDQVAARLRQIANRRRVRSIGDRVAAAESWRRLA